jgi:hypothetical protein
MIPSVPNLFRTARSFSAVGLRIEDGRPLRRMLKESAA